METPKATFDGADLYPTVFLKAAAYAFHIAESQAFVDGNKRATLDVAEPMELYDAMIAIAEHKISNEKLADLFEKLTAVDLSVGPR